jgi:hypothetical protein
MSDYVLKRDYSRNICFDQLPKDEQNEDESVYTLGDDLMYQFYCGNWSSTAKEMEDKNISCSEFCEYVTNMENELGKCDFTEWFDRSFFAELGSQKGIRIN